MILIHRQPPEPLKRVHITSEGDTPYRQRNVILPLSSVSFRLCSIEIRLITRLPCSHFTTGLNLTAVQSQQKKYQVFTVVPHVCHVKLLSQRSVRKINLALLSLSLFRN